MAILNERHAFGYVDQISTSQSWCYVKGWAFSAKDGEFQLVSDIRVKFAGIPIQAVWSRVARPAVNKFLNTAEKLLRGQASMTDFNLEVLYGFECIFASALVRGISINQLCELLEIEAISRDGFSFKLDKTIYESATGIFPREIISLFNCPSQKHWHNGAQDELEMPNVMRQGLFGKHMNSLHVEWTLTDMCSYNCSYCGGWVKKIEQAQFHQPRQHRYSYCQYFFCSSFALYILYVGRRADYAS